MAEKLTQEEAEELARELTQEEAEALPWQVRFVAYAKEMGLTPEEALEHLAELGLRKVLEDRMLADPDYRLPYYLWVSYKALLSDG